MQKNMGGSKKTLDRLEFYGIIVKPRIMGFGEKPISSGIIPPFSSET